MEQLLEKTIDVKDINQHPNSRKIKVVKINNIAESRANQGGHEYLSEIQTSKGGLQATTGVSNKFRLPLTHEEEQVLFSSLVPGYAKEEFNKIQRGHAPQLYKNEHGETGASTLFSETTSEREQYLSSVILKVEIGTPVLLEIGKKIDNDKGLVFFNEKNEKVINEPLNPLDYLYYCICLTSPRVAKTQRERYNSIPREFYLVDELENAKDIKDLKEDEDKVLEHLLSIKSKNADLHLFGVLLGLPTKFKKDASELDIRANYDIIRNYIITDNIKENEKKKRLKAFLNIKNDEKAKLKFKIRQLVNRGGLLEVGDTPDYYHPETNRKLASGMIEMLAFIGEDTNKDVIAELERIATNKK